MQVQTAVFSFGTGVLLSCVPASLRSCASPDEVIGGDPERYRAGSSALLGSPSQSVLIACSTETPTHDSVNELAILLCDGQTEQRPIKTKVGSMEKHGDG
ncbi:hypothetical protein F4680DRAFT_471243 [Xylaria scruposa]|nr:hypothetical protein F4680DRAFT_471243 [Xylaria scruposa]